MMHGKSKHKIVDALKVTRFVLQVGVKIFVVILYEIYHKDKIEM
jgi:hypothetical protein